MARAIPPPFEPAAATRMPGSAPTASTPKVMSSSRKIKPNSLGTCGRASRHASPVVTGLPSTARLVTVVSSAVAATVPMREIRKTTVVPSMVSPRARVSSSALALGSLRAALPALSFRTKPWSRMTRTSVTTATVSEMPRTVRQ